MNDKIDFVITWVDGQDEKWLNKKRKYEEKTNINSEANSKNRYRDWGLLKYWFRGVEKYANWVNKIFLITDHQVPDWLDISNEKVIIVNHDDYIPKEYLPTFNSNTIELFINNIKGLSEKFVYFNDDMFITNYVKKEYFFYNDFPKDALIFNAVSVADKNCIIEHTILNNLELISKEYKKNSIIDRNFTKVFNIKYGKNLFRNFLLMPWKYYTGIYNQHMPISYLKTSFKHIWDNYEENLSKSSRNKFRTKNDYSHWIVRYYQLMSSNFETKSFKKDHYYSLKNNNERFFRDLKRGKYNMVCINDDDENLNFDEVKEDLIECFSKILPEKSSFEK